jgi:hypothetical protein
MADCGQCLTIRTEQRLKLVLRCGYIQIGYYDLVLLYEDVEISLERRACASSTGTENSCGLLWVCSRSVSV